MMSEVKMTLSNIDRAGIAEFIAHEQKGAPDWFLSDAAENFAAATDIVLYFSAFCVALSHLNSALGQMDTTLKRIKAIMSRWHALVQDKDGHCAGRGEQPI
jgi:spore maturation protein SpmB